MIGEQINIFLILVKSALYRIRRPPQKARREEYPELADKIIEGQNPGSSAGGEQAKFATYSRERESHVIVKFSPKNESDLASRWRDILITEFIACETLHEFNIPAAEVELFDCGDRLFLESIRFDRTGEYGRLPLISMQAVDNEFTGVGAGWQKVGSELHQKGLISWQHLVDICVYWGFGKLINNTDMHLGNLSFSLDGGEGFSLSPVYDMCSMGFAPRSSGEIAPLTFTPPEINETILVDTAALVKSMAKHFWNRLAENEMISEELSHYLQEDNPANFIND